METREPTLRVRINQIDYVVTQPGPLDNSALPRVPVIRVFGESSTGKKACAHIHQVYPYFFIEYQGKTNPDSVNRYIARLTHSLNHAIAISLKRNPGSPKSQFVRAILLVKGVHFYGFHASYSPFLKIYITDPTFVNRAVTILQSGTIMKTRFRIYESHLSFILQFLCDFGLYGCGWMDLAEVWERGQEDVDGVRKIDGEAEESDPTFKASPYFRQTRMPLEVDAAAHQILNRHRILARDIHHEMTIPAPPLPPEPLVLSVRELWEDERRRRLARGLSPSPVIPMDLSENSRGHGGEWVAEARWWDEIRKRIEKERVMEEVKSTDKGWERWVMTTFESVEALWEERWKVWKPRKRVEGTEAMKAGQAPDEFELNPYGTAVTQGSRGPKIEDSTHVDVDVDEALLSSQVMTGLVAREEAEWERLIGEQKEDDDEDEMPVDDQGAEGGPPPQLYNGDDQSGNRDEDSDNVNNLQRTPKKMTLSQRSNPFQDAFMKLAGPSRYRSSSVVSNYLATPTKSRTYIALKSPIVSPLKPDPAARHDSGSHPLVDLSPENPFLDHPAMSATSEYKISPAPASDAAHSVAYRSRTPQSEGLVERDDALDIGFEASLLQRDDSPGPSIDHAREVELVHEERPLVHGARRDIQQDIGEGFDERPRKRPRLHCVEGDNPLPSMSSAESAKAASSVSSQLKVALKVATNLPFSSLSEGYHGQSASYTYRQIAPSVAELLATIDQYGIPNKIYRDPYYSKARDAPERPREYAGLVFHLKGGDGLGNLQEWMSSTSANQVPGNVKGQACRLDNCGIGGWEYASVPPSGREVRYWLAQEDSRSNVDDRPKRLSQIEGPTQANPYGLKTTPTAPSDADARERGNMTVLSLEVFAPSRGCQLPDPGLDEVVAVFYSFYGVDHQRPDSDSPFLCDSGIIVVESPQLDHRKLRNWSLDVVETELDLLNRVIDVVQDIDPDIIVGWEVQAASWGYLNARCRIHGLDLGDQISRAPGRHTGDYDPWGMRTTSTFKVTGRHVLNIWRIMRAEQTLGSYTLENVVFNLLHRRTPRYSASTLTGWFRSAIPEHVSRLLRYYSSRTTVVLEIIDVAEIVTKNAEFARVFGVDFFSVLSRGSQFKVESFMFRIAKPESFVLLSPSKQDVGKQNAAECMPLIMEPLSAFYNSPLVVLDFQSLYPSIMIAYNYCYSTCLGRVTDFKGQNKFGVTELRQPAGLLESLKDHIHVAPNGMIYVKPEVRKGLLGRMLTEILDTRVMVKQAMKGMNNDKALRKVLDARQLGLKFIANVTYGYTSATFSGRMPAVEIADSIVQSGRETLEKAIRVINSTQKWGAKVVYGDTDSLFIYLRGKSKEQAFRIGHDMADTITAMNPAPIKLKFEKVYLPCVLMAKKRYVGFKFENADDVDPVFDAKGIETVRRDGVPAQQKMTEACLKILFRTQDLSQVKDYCCRSWSRVLENKASIQDFIFAKEVKMGTYSEKVPPPPGVTVAARRMVQDPNDEPQYGERIPYVIVRGQPNSRLVDRAVAPEEVLNDSHKCLDASYYISRVLIPPLERIFNLVGADVRSWFDEMPKTLKTDHGESLLFSPKKAKQYAAQTGKLKIDEHFISSNCLVCGFLTSSGICETCRMDREATIHGLLSRVRKTEERSRNVHLICASCVGTPPSEPIQCESLDCPWLYERKKLEKKTGSLSVIQDLIEEIEVDYSYSDDATASSPTRSTRDHTPSNIHDRSS